MPSANALTTVQKLYIAYYGRAADAAGQNYWAGELDKAGGSLTGIIDAFANAQEAQALYGSGTTVNDRITVLYQNILGRAPDAGGLAYWAGEVAAGRLSLGNTALAVLEGVQPGSSDAPLANNRLSVANSFTAQVGSAPNSYGGDAAAAIARTFLKQVTGDAASVLQATNQQSAYLNTLGVASRQPDKFVPLISNGLLTSTAIVSTTLTDGNMEAAVQALAPTATGAEDAAGIGITLSGSEVNGSVASFVIKSLPTTGTLKSGEQILSVGSVVEASHSAAALTFVPKANFNGATSFVFAARDSAGQEDATPATATITVTPVNDAPVGVVDTASTLYGTVVTIDVLANDTDVDNANYGNAGLSIKAGSVSLQAMQGTATMQNGKIVFMPAVNFSGSATISYVVTDGTADSAATAVVVNVAPRPNQAPQITMPVNTEFTTKIDYYTGYYGQKYLVGADLNGDGQNDLLMASNDNVSTLIYQSGGSFLRKNYPEYSASFVQAADINNDNIIDIISTNFSNNNFSVRLGKGNGLFADPVKYSTGAGSGPVQLVTADMNNDGRVDVIIANESSDSLAIFLGKAEGGFNSKIDFPVGSSLDAINVADFNGDGKLDIVADGATFSLFTGKGDGALNSGVNLQIGGTNPSSIIAEDFNADSKPDLIVTNYDANTISALINDGNGGFKPNVDYGVGTKPSNVHSADLNADGKPDLLVANYANNLGYGSAGTVSILINKGDGVFSPSANYQANYNPTAVTSIDVNDDGRLDILVGNSSDSYSISAFLNAGDTRPFTSKNPIKVNGNLTITDIDGNADWNGGKMKVQITGSPDAADKLVLPALQQDGNTVWINENNNNALVVGSTTIGQASALQIGSSIAWTFTFNEKATNFFVQSVARAITFNNSSDNPTAGVRTVTFSATDKHGNSSSADMQITVFNFKPTIVTASSSASFLSPDATELVAAAATATPLATDSSDSAYYAQPLPIVLTGTLTDASVI